MNIEIIIHKLTIISLFISTHIMVLVIWWIILFINLLMWGFNYFYLWLFPTSVIKFFLRKYPWYYEKHKSRLDNYYSYWLQNYVWLIIIGISLLFFVYYCFFSDYWIRRFDIVWILVFYYCWIRIWLDFSCELVFMIDDRNKSEIRSHMLVNIFTALVIWWFTLFIVHIPDILMSLPSSWSWPHRIRIRL